MGCGRRPRRLWAWQRRYPERTVPVAMAADGLLLSPAQMAEFERDGATLVTLPWSGAVAHHTPTPAPHCQPALPARMACSLTQAALATAAEAQLSCYEALWDRGPYPSSYGGTTGIICTSGYPDEQHPRAYPEENPCPACPVDPAVPDNIDADYVRMVAEPCLEAIAKQALCCTPSSTTSNGKGNGGSAEGVVMLQTSRMARFPDATHEFEDFTSPSHTWPARYGESTEWANRLHIDHTVRLSDLEARPRRDVVSIWVWLSDVPSERAAMRILPGSHRQLGEHWERMITTWQAHPDKPLPVPQPAADGGPAAAEQQRQPGDADLSIYAPLEPRAVVARRGQALVFTQSLVHAGWHNSDTSPRKAIYTTWCARSAVSLIGGTITPQGGKAQIAELSNIHVRLGRVLAPLGRAGIVLTVDEIEAAVGGWEEQWPPTLRHRHRL